MVSNALEPVRLAIDVEAGFLYWSERMSFKVMRCSVATVPCGQPELVVQNGINAGVPYGIAIDPVDKMLYWTGSSEVNRCNVQSSSSLPCAPRTVAGPFLSLNGIVGIALNLKKRKVYWSLKTKIEECPMEINQPESNIKLVTANVDLVRGLALDSVSDTLYMAEGISSGQTSRIRSCNVYEDVASCADTRVLMSGCPATGCLNMPYDVAIDWSEDSVKPENRQLPAWATAAWGDDPRAPNNHTYGVNTSAGHDASNWQDGWRQWN